LWESKLKSKLQPRKLKEQLENIVMEGNNARVTVKNQISI
jgi:hypothetical protein